MSTIHKKALVIGSSKGVGRALAIGLANAGVETVAVARNEAGLNALKAKAPSVKTIASDAAADGASSKLLDEVQPDLLILAGGNQPAMKPLSQQSWNEFSATWNADTKIAFEFTRAALNGAMPDGGTVVSFASGAAIGGSPLSGGYAGAKRMQHYVSNYANWEAGRRGLDLTFITIYPKQLVTGTEIAKDASSAYADAASISAEKFMSQWEKPLTVDVIASSVIELLADSGQKSQTYGISGAGLEVMA
ncbi:MAG: SDR family NAD(P)-dependent oxidoreductase [Rhizobiaceae bacterium]